MVSMSGRRSRPPRVWPWIACLAVGPLGVAVTKVWISHEEAQLGGPSPDIGAGFPAVLGLLVGITGLVGLSVALVARWRARKGGGWGR